MMVIAENPVHGAHRDDSCSEVSGSQEKDSRKAKRENFVADS
jgi:hypothetical protein